MNLYNKVSIFKKRRGPWKCFENGLITRGPYVI
uniref:Uncharacterized protein n=1 Tax=Lepeophtheirus salmonis TaxID=72036 RepID=A0A0K2U1D7_LEPSM